MPRRGGVAGNDPGVGGDFQLRHEPEASPKWVTRRCGLKLGYSRHCRCFSCAFDGQEGRAHSPPLMAIL